MTLKSSPPSAPERQCGWAVLLALLLGFAGGCSEEAISSYAAPKDPSLPAWAVDDAPRVRMLVAMISHGEKVWFFKFVGSDEAVTAQLENFETFVRSIAFKPELDAKRPFEWKLPHGWSEEKAEGASGLTLATIRAGDGERPPLMTVTALDAKSKMASDVLANVNRWRAQLGYVDRDQQPIEISAGELGQYAVEHKMPCGNVTIVDLLSVRLPGSAGQPRMEARDESAAPRVKYDMPEGWRLSEKPARMAMVTLTAGPADRAAQATISAMPGAAGGVVSNVNRWRGQVGLEPIGIDEIKKAARKLTINGQPAAGFQFVAEGELNDRKAMIAALAPGDGVTWFIKLFGPAETVLAEAKAFDKFTESIRFDEEAAAERSKP